jgi:RHH-type proline utilization regulon transcriptional repressor/proline dehydrogenase/delta 1-pyrroline-5-carboxylate dehydrogenase
MAASGGHRDPDLGAYVDWLESRGEGAAAARCARSTEPPRETARELRGTVGERNVYELEPRGLIALIAPSLTELMAQFGAVLASGNRAIADGDLAVRLRADLPASLAERLTIGDGLPDANLAGVLLFGARDDILACNRRLAEREGAILPLITLDEARRAAGEDYDVARLLDEKSISTNTAAAGGNAALLMAAAE